MKEGASVQTPYGPGTLEKREGTEGILAKRWLVKLDQPEQLNATLRNFHQQLGGLYFHQDDINHLTIVK